MIDRVVDEIRTSNCIVIVGAGASFQAGMPLAGQLSPLVWHTLDAAPSLRKDVATDLGVADSEAKYVVADDWERVKTAFVHIASDGAARKEFQDAFVRLDHERSAVRSPAHEALSRLIRAGYAEFAVSFNWDSLIECAFERRYGVEVNSQGTRLFKPHGDVRSSADEWVLPQSSGVLQNDVLLRVNDAVAIRPRLLLVVGYSERDDVILSQLIQPLQARWRVARISPNASGELAVRLPAHQALEQLAERLCPEPETPGWQFVTFTTSRDLGPAIAGERLGPSDVGCCPRLPQVARAGRQLAIAHVVEIAGPAGAGKSITAYQAAADIQRRGYEILRPIEPPGSEKELLQTLEDQRRKCVFIVDDAQRFSAQFRVQLGEVANERRKIVIATTDREALSRSSVWVGRGEAVKAIAEAYMRRRDEVLPIVRSFDPRVGDSYMDESIERRIEHARSAADTPWEFNYNLRGGWRRAYDLMERFRDHERADLLLVLVAVKQIVSLDQPVDRAWIGDVVWILGRTVEWTRSCAERLLGVRALIDQGGLRCPHINVASIVIQCFLEHADDNQRESVVKLMEHVLCDSQTPVRGIVWFLNELSSAGIYRGSELLALLLNDSTCALLTRRCLSATEPEARRDAAWLLNRLGRARTEGQIFLVSHGDILARWLEQAAHPAVYGLGSLVNDLWNEERKAARDLVGKIDPLLLAASFARADVTHVAGWGYLLGRLGCAAPDEWRQAFGAAINSTSTLSLARALRGASATDISPLAYGVYSFNKELAYAVLDATEENLKESFHANPLTTWEDIHNDLLWVVLGHMPRFLRGKRKPTARQFVYSRRIAALIPPDRMAQELLSSRPRDWERFAHMIEWIEEVEHERYAQIIEKVDLEALDARTEGFWSNPPRELRLLVNSLAVTKEREPARSWVARHMNELRKVDALVTAIAPDAAIAAFDRGATIDLFEHNRHEWGLAALALAEIRVRNEGSARRIAEQHLADVADRISHLQAIDCKKLPQFLEFIDGLDATLSTRILNSISLKDAAKHWTDRVSEGDRRKQRNRSARATLRDLLRRCQACDEPVRAMAATLEQQLSKKL